MATAGFSFKLDPSSLPRLNSRGDNYAEWRAAWTIAFRYAELWDVVSDGKAPTVSSPPTDAETALQTKWKKDDNKAMVMLMSAVHEDIVMLVTTASTASQAWTALADRYDRDTAHSTIQQFRRLTSMRFDENEDLVQHLDAFHQTWVNMERRCRTSEHELAKNLLAVFSSQSIKGLFFLSTLPESMDNVVDNLSTRGVNKFVDIEPKMFDIAYRRQQPMDEKALYTKTAGKRTNPRSATNNDECTWCRKHNLAFVGHVYTNCHKLADFKKQKDKNKNKTNVPNKSKKGKHNACQATTSDSGDDDDETSDTDEVQAFVATYAASSPSHTASVVPETRSTTLGTRSATLESQHIVDLTDDDAIHAFAVNVTPNLFLSLQRLHGSLIPVPPDTCQAIRRVSLTYDRAKELYPSLAAPNCQSKGLDPRYLTNTRLFSWSHVRHRFRLTGHADNITVYTNGGKCAMWAKFHDGGFKIQAEDDIHTADDFGYIIYQPDETHTDNAAFPITKTSIVLLVMSRMSRNTAQRLYADGNTVPTKPPDWHCYDCEMAKSTSRKLTTLAVLDGHERAQWPFDVIHTDLSGKFNCYLHIPRKARQPGTKLHDRAERAFLVGFESPSVMRLYVPTRRAITTATLSNVRFLSAANKVHWDLEDVQPPGEPAVSLQPGNKRSTSAEIPMIQLPHMQSTTRTNTPAAQQTGQTTPTTPTTPGMNRSPWSPPSRVINTVRQSTPLLTSQASSTNTPSPPATRRGPRYGKTYTAKPAAEDNDCVIAFAMIAVDDDIPTTLTQALRSSELTHWQRAADAELSALTTKGVWVETPLPKGQPIMTPLRLPATTPFGLLSDLALRAETAYLYSNLSHEVYMSVPDGYKCQTDKPIALRLAKALYGLKQSGRKWFGTLKRTIKNMKMVSLPSNPCVFQRHDLIVAVYVDDIVITGTDEQVVSFKTLLSTRYKCKDLGPCRYLLGLEVTQTSQQITISQSGYVKRILQRFGMANSKGRDTPLDTGTLYPRSSGDDERADVVEYQQLSGLINFLVTAERALVYRRLHDDGMTPTNKSALSVHLEVYADASYNSDPDTAKSVRAYVVQLNGSTIAWSAKKQKTVARSTCEAECMACSDAASQLLWIR
ncbi:uncharacterized protein Triagg1_2809 [Trichoderma aggressivum f. europaeum]|uniref:Reverse transcriptase Ty1/copia-type domain-containing protein n=1 Tax=Trichoderma aggressivum f. europaeum TaxID=173218 RepID=A0AAE1IHP5_9HYPO|nr:hypothetical protein Triagg1_2809 [Trichoderma aggressivum f. europaeum]